MRVQLSDMLGRFPWLHRPWPYELLIVAVIALLFGRTVTYGFVNFDDDANVTGNVLLHPATLRSLVVFWTQPWEDLYVPLFYTVLWFDQVLGGGRAWIFHLTIVLLHMGSALFVLGILRRIAESFAFLEALPVEHKEYRKLAAATMGALVFACHPAQTEAVCWVTGLKDVLAGCLSLAAIYAYLVSAGPPVDMKDASLQRNVKVRARSYWLALLCFVLALLAKPGCVTLPLAALAINTLLLRRPLRKSIHSLVPWFAIAVGWVGVTFLSQPVPEWIRALVPAWKRPLLAADSTIFYLRLMLWPRNLVTIYPRTPADAVTGVHCWVNLLEVLVAAAATVYFTWRGYRVFPSIVVLFIVPLLPVLGFAPFLYHAVASVANRYLYLSLLSIAIVYAWMWLAAASHPIPRARRSLAVGLILVAIGHALSQTPAQIRIWANSRTLWEHQFKFAPDVGIAHGNMAQVLALEGRKSEAEAEFRKAYELDNHLTLALTKRALLVLDRGDFAEGMRLLTQAVADYKQRGVHDQRLAGVYNDLGVAYLRQGRFLEAYTQFDLALSIDPDNPIYLENRQEALNQ